MEPSVSVATGRRDHWDEYWRRYRLTNSAVATRRLTANITARMIAAHLNKPGRSRPLRVLDLGCGDGHLTGLLTERLSKSGQVQMIGLDGSPAALTVARDRAAAGISFSAGNATALPFANGAFDAVVSFGYASVASYNDSRIQREIVRVLDGGGLLVSDFENMLSLYNLLRPRRVFTQWRRYTDVDSAKPSYHFSTFGLAAYFRSVGLDLAAVQYTNSFAPVKSILPAGLLMAFDRSARALRLSRPLGRIFIAAFRKGDLDAATGERS